MSVDEPQESGCLAGFNDVHAVYPLFTNEGSNPGFGDVGLHVIAFGACDSGGDEVCGRSLAEALQASFGLGPNAPTGNADLQVILARQLGEVKGRWAPSGCRASK